MSCLVPFRSRFVASFFDCWRQHLTPTAAATRFHLSLRTVQRLFARFADLGEAGIDPDYRCCGQHQPAHTSADLVEQICQTRRDHCRWGSEMIRLELDPDRPDLPCARTIRRQLAAAGLQPAPPGRIPAGPGILVPRATAPHQGWQVDASEEIVLQSQQRVCWLRIVDEYSGAFLQTTVFSVARWEHVERHLIQQAVRQAYQRWGLPTRKRVDNGYPFGSSGDFPPEMALWVIGLGIAVLWIPPARPQHNGVVERSQRTGQDWFEPHTCWDAAQLQQRCDELDRRQRERYPHRDGRSRWEVYPGLRHSGRKYHPRRESAQWEVQKVWDAVAETVAARQVDCTGSVSVYNRHLYVGKPYIRQTVYLSLDPTGPTWVIAAADGTELRTHPAEELAAERIRSLAVTCRKWK